MERYNFKQSESKWQKFWDDKKLFLSKVDKDKKKFYCLEMFPYPSGKIQKMLRDKTTLILKLGLKKIFQL